MYHSDTIGWLTGQPAGIRYTNSGKVFSGDVPGGVKVGVKLKPALLAPEHRLRAAVGAVNMPTAGAGLGCVAGVHPSHGVPLRFCLILQEGAELGEAPGVQAAVGLPAPLFSPAPDVHQVLHHDGSAGGDRINDAPGEHVVAVPPEAVNLPGQFAQVAFGRGGAFGLEVATEPEVPVVYFPPATGAEEMVVGRDGGTYYPQVYAHCLALVLEGHVRNRQDDVQPEAALPGDQVGAVEADRSVQQRGGVRVEPEGDSDAPPDRGQGCHRVHGEHSVGAGVVPDGDESPLGAGCLAALALPGEYRLDRLGGPHPGGANELGREPGVLDPQRVVGGLVELDPVLFPVVPPVGGDGVEADGVLLEGIPEDIRLVRTRSQLQSNCALHGHILPHSVQEVKGQLPLHG